MPKPKPPLGKFGYLWVTLALFLFSLAGQFVFGWYVYNEEQAAHGQPVETAAFIRWTLKDMFENWQSEFLQLCWQVGGLSVLWYVGSPQSKEQEERLEEKVDRLLDAAYGDEATPLRKDIESRYPKE